ncbi:hypothetical protein CTI12_AA274160 [Artemisia annua]|uniref:Uncharacterized protein n=1 Tax=Artemisia annua TaxID=35608 RepID=A0A2U1NER1_ARTAN|nr:hypothetical protein CTI12_AA274160 [Artemisia annua]
MNKKVNWSTGRRINIVVGCSTHPIDLIKMRMQLQGEALPFHAPHAPVQVVRSGPVSVRVKIFQTEGVGALFSGNSTTVLRQTLYSTTSMGF